MNLVCCYSCRARILLLINILSVTPTFISYFVIDLLSILKVIIYSAIATDDRYPLWSCSIYQNAANCKIIRFRYIARLGGDSYAHTPLTSRSSSMPSKKIMESSEEVFRCRNCSKARPHVSRLRRSLEANERIRFARLVYTRPWTSKFSCSFFCNNGVTSSEDTGFWTPEAYWT